MKTLIEQVHACAKEVIAAGEKLIAVQDEELKEKVQCIAEHKACKQRAFYESNIINILKKKETMKKNFLDEELNLAEELEELENPDNEDSILSIMFPDFLPDEMPDDGDFFC